MPSEEIVEKDEKVRRVTEMLRIIRELPKDWGEPLSSPNVKVEIYDCWVSEGLIEPLIKEVEVERKLISSEQKLEYARWYRMQRKKREKEIDAKKKLKEKKKLALEGRKKGYCVRCREVVALKDRQIVEVNTRGVHRLVMKGLCPKCDFKLSFSGGKVGI